MELLYYDLSTEPLIQSMVIFYEDTCPPGREMKRFWRHTTEYDNVSTCSLSSLYL